MSQVVRNSAEQRNMYSERYMSPDLTVNTD